MSRASANPIAIRHDCNEEALDVVAASLFKYFAQVITGDASPPASASPKAAGADDNEVLFQRLDKDLAQLELDIQKQVTVQQVHVQELEQYDSLQERLGRNLSAIQADLQALKHQSAVERQRRAELEELETLIAKVHEFLSRQDSDAQIRQLEAEIAELEKRTSGFDGDLLAKRREFGLFHYALQQLENNWEPLPGEPDIGDLVAAEQPQQQQQQQPQQQQASAETDDPQPRSKQARREPSKSPAPQSSQRRSRSRSSG